MDSNYNNNGMTHQMPSGPGGAQGGADELPPPWYAFPHSTSVSRFFRPCNLLDAMYHRLNETNPAGSGNSTRHTRPSSTSTHPQTRPPHRGRTRPSPLGRPRLNKSKLSSPLSVTTVEATTGPQWTI